MLRLTEEIALFLFDETRGDFRISISTSTLDLIFAGAVLMDLAIEDRIDTDMEKLMLVDPTPLDDDIIDPTLAAIASNTEDHGTPYWVGKVATRGESIRNRALARLVERDILKTGDDGSFRMARRFLRSRRYSIAGQEPIEEVKLRIMRVLFADDVPEPRDVLIVSLANASGVFSELLSPSELEQVRDRIALMSKLDLIGRSVGDAIRKRVQPLSELLKSVGSSAIPEAAGIPIVGNALSMRGDRGHFLAEQYAELGPVFRVRAFNRRFVVLAGREANLLVARKGDVYFRTFEVLK